MKDHIVTDVSSLSNAESVRRRFSGPKDKRKRKFQYQAFIWMLPAFLFLFIFSYYPPIRALIDSFFSSAYNEPYHFVGFNNYTSMFTDKLFWICVANTFIFTVIGLVLGNLMTILLAELLYNLRNKKSSGFFRVLFILPILVPSIVIILIWKYVVFGSDGFINQMYMAMTGTNVPLEFYTSTSNEFLVKFAIIMTNFPWVAGTSFLIYLAGLQNISSSVIEASRLDNCSTFKRIVKIDMPLLLPQLKYFLIMGIIGGIQNFNLQLVIIEKQHPFSDVLGLYLYNNAFGIDSGIRMYEYASAVGIFIFIITLGLTIFSNVSTRKKQ